MILCRRCNGTGQEPDQSKLGAQMRAKRMDAGVSLREVARRLNVSAAYLSDLERGNRAWKPDYLKAYESLKFIAFVNSTRARAAKRKGKK